MERGEFRQIRTMLGKSQRELSSLLGISLKSVESYEQGWRNIPPTIERLIYFLFFKSNPSVYIEELPCWEAKSCGEVTKNECITYIAHEGHFCWFFTGGLCSSAKASGKDERLCTGCEVFLQIKNLVETAVSARL